MAKRDEAAELWQRRKVERDRRVREKKHAKEHACELDLERTLAGLGSADETTRAKAARELCPCRTDWEVFEQTLGTLQRLTKDPSPLVRANALHVFEDAFELDNQSLPTTPQAITNEMAARRREMRWGDQVELDAGGGRKRGNRDRGRR